MLLVCLLIIGIQLIAANAGGHDEIEYLTRHFFANLEENLKDERGNPYEFIDRQVDNYIAVIKESHPDVVHAARSRRAAIKSNPIGFNKLQGLIPKDKFAIKVEYPMDIMIFHQKNSSYAAILTVREMILFKYEGDKFNEINRTASTNGLKLGMHSQEKVGTFIVVAENAKSHSKVPNKTAVYLFDADERLKIIQYLDVDYVSDVSIWGFNQELHMIVTRYYTKVNDTYNYEVDGLVYKYKNGYFDLVQKIPTVAAIKVQPFVVDKRQYVAIANNRSAVEGEERFTEIFKYDVEKEEFVSFQRIITEEIFDLEAFCFSNTKVTHNFLVIASRDPYAQMHNSIIYKYVDDSFLPIQSLNLDSPTNWLPVVGTDGAFALFVAEARGLKIFQYTGWIFAVTKTQYNEGSMGPGIINMNSEFINGVPVVVVANAKDDGTMTKIYEVCFESKVQVDSTYMDFLEWCQKSLQQAKLGLPTDIPTRSRTSSSDEDDPLIDITDARIKKPIDRKRQAAFEDGSLESQLEVASLEMQGVEDELDRNLLKKNINIISGDVIADSIVFHEDLFSDIYAERINDNIDVNRFLSNVININSDFELQKLDLATARFEEDFVTEFINGRPSSEMLSTEVSLESLNIEGDVVFVSAINVEDNLNNIAFSKENILLVKGDQIFKKGLNLSNVDAEEISTKYINKLLMSSIPHVSRRKMITKLDSLRAKNVVIDGLLNNIDLPTLYKYVLRNSGDQEITTQYIFDELKVENVETRLMNGINVPHDLVVINEGEFEIEQEVIFLQDIAVDEVFVSSKLNDVNVLNGKLDVLLRNSNDVQHISGSKSFESIDMLAPIKLQCKIKCEQLDRINPVTKFRENIVVSGNYTLEGDVTVENLLQTTDLKPTNSRYSLGSLQQFGLRVADTQIPIHLVFKQQLNVLDVSADRINGIETQAWVVNGGNDTQRIKGWKIFEGDLVIVGDTSLLNVNGIHLHSFDQNVLKIDGDQVITGKHHIASINTPSIYSSSIKMGQRDWSDLVLNNVEQIITGTTKIQSLEVGGVETENVSVNGKINGIDLSEMLSDSVYVDSTDTIGGRKWFKNVTVDNLTSKKDIKMNKIPTMLKKAQATFNEDLELSNNVAIEKITFKSTMNGISADEFAANWVNGEDIVIAGDKHLDTLILHGGLFVDSNRINNVDLTDLAVNSVKADEPHTFNSIQFKNDLIALSGFELRGHIEKVDINNIVADADIELILTDSITFNENVTILDGKLYVEGLVNGKSLGELCTFSDPVNGDEKNLIIEGNAFFAKSPKVDLVNGLSISEIHQNTWLRNRETTFKGHLDFGDLHFESDVFVRGYVNEVPLDWVKNNYLSKSRNQTVVAKLDFAEGIVFASDVIAPKCELKGSLSGIDLNSFFATAILQDQDQIFEEIPYIQTVYIDELSGEFLLNNYNLQSDLMRYDAPNVVTGKKVVQDLTTDVLSLNRNNRIQDVDVLDWMQKAVPKTGNFQVKGRLHFENDTIFKNGIGLEGSFNQMKFNSSNILLKSSDQTITAKKIFNSNTNSFQSIKLQGLFNNIEVGKFVDRLALREGDQTFVTPLTFNSELTAGNIQIDGLYQGVNVSELLFNLTHVISVNNYYNNYANLKEISTKIQDSLKHQAHYLSHYRTVQIFESVGDVLFVKNLLGEPHLAMLGQNGSQYLINFWIWSQHSETFVYDPRSLEILYNHYFTLVTPLEYDTDSYLFIEHLTYDDPHNSFLGELISVVNSTAIEIVGKIPSNGTKQALALTIPNAERACILLVYHSSHTIDIYCDEEELHLFQRLKISKALMATTITIDSCSYILAIAEESSLMVWQYDENTKLFTEHQNIYVVSPNSVSTVTYNGLHYLAIGSRHLLDTVYPGQVELMRFDVSTKLFTKWQEFSINAPIQVEFAVLPSNELILYVLCDSSTEPLVMYQYQGIAKFSRTFAASSLMKCSSITQFSTSNNHFIIAKGNNEFRIIEAIFKGNKY
ncbi:PREDICTED: uncharacterized protein LOC108562216 isoform X2 [Nicrophorus vespilloides]|uniref:Uncharacterized protein LOC108562216 isoform X2 n=1 Tax=Nicrophorus vespilloides TaxID=110193 RepID=A0ABM1MN22_NICVS|nr:PREDICTED: uncharacterized protein LOC108562216 isoform X2 [Nicrophorus vespilloides]